MRSYKKIKSKKNTTQKLGGCILDDKRDTRKLAKRIAELVLFRGKLNEYINNIYADFEYYMDIYPNFLLNEECIDIYNLFESIIKSTDVKHKKKYSTFINIHEIRSNDVLFIKPPDPHGEYHYFIACINSDKTQVSVYQSWGSTLRLFKKNFTFEEFIQYLKNLETVKFNKNNNNNEIFKRDFTILFEIERELYGIQQVLVKTQELALEQEEQNEKDENPVYDSEVEEDRQDMEVAQFLGIAFTYYQDLKRSYLSIEKKPIRIKAYRIRSYNVTKRRTYRTKRTITKRTFLTQ